MLINGICPEKNAVFVFFDRLLGFILVHAMPFHLQFSLFSYFTLLRFLSCFFPFVVPFSTLVPVLIFTFVCLLTNMSFLRCPAVVHGQRKGRGAVAQQTDLTEAGEAHGKSCDLKDTTNTRFFLFPGLFDLFFIFCQSLSYSVCVVLKT